MLLVLKALLEPCLVIYTDVYPNIPYLLVEFQGNTKDGKLQVYQDAELFYMVNSGTKKYLKVA